MSEGKSQLDRIEKKMDKILELLEGRDLTTTVTLDGKQIGRALEQERKLKKVFG